MLDQLSYNDVYRRGADNDVFDAYLKWSDVKALLEEILEANQQQHSKYAVNQILRREGIQVDCGSAGSKIVKYQIYESSFLLSSPSHSLY